MSVNEVILEAVPPTLVVKGPVAEVLRKTVKPVSSVAVFCQVRSISLEEAAVATRVVGGGVGGVVKFDCEPYT